MTDTQNSIILCPGQGAQAVGMGKEWFEASDAAKQTFTEADQILGIELSKLCFEGPADDLNRTDVAQAAIYTTTVHWPGHCTGGQIIPHSHKPIPTLV